MPLLWHQQRMKISEGYFQGKSNKALRHLRRKETEVI